MIAADWMKMRTNLWDDPRVGAIADDAGTNEAAVIGALYWLWATACFGCNRSKGRKTLAEWSRT